MADNTENFLSNEFPTFAPMFKTKVGYDALPTPYGYRLNGPEEFLALAVPGSEKLSPSSDEQTGTMTLEFSGAARMSLMAGNFDMVNPTTIGQINFLDDMSYGNGDFVYELHIDWPSTNSPVTGTYGAFAQLTTVAGIFLQMGAYLFNAEGTTTVLTARIHDDLVNGVKRYSLWVNGVPSFQDLEIGADIAEGIDLASLYAVIYMQEPADSNVDQAKFTSPSPKIKSRFVTNPAEMIYAESVLVRTAKTITGGGQVLIPFTPISLDNKLVSFQDSDNVFTTVVGANSSVPGDPVGLRLDQSRGMEFTDNLISIEEPLVVNLQAKSPSGLSDFNSPGDTLHENWIEFDNNDIHTYAYMWPVFVGDGLVSSFQIDVWMLDEDTPPELSSSSGSTTANFSLAGRNSIIPTSNITVTKLEPFRYRIKADIFGDIDGSGFGVVCYSNNTFRPFRVSGYIGKEMLGYHSYTSVAPGRPTLTSIPVTGKRNLLTYTENFNNPAWIKNSGGTGSVPVVTPNFAEAPDGTMTAARLQASLNGGNTTSDFSYLLQATPSTMETATRSCWLKVNSGESARVHLEVSTPSGVMTVTNEWQRYNVTTTSGLGSMDIGLRGGVGTVDDSVDILFWHPQFEEGELVTDYQSVQNSSNVTESGIDVIKYLHFDGLDDKLICTLPSITGGQIILISRKGTWISDFDFAGGTFELGPDTYTGGPAGLLANMERGNKECIILSSPMTPEERTLLIEYAISSGSAGEITVSDTLISNLPDIENTWGTNGAATLLGNTLTFGPNSTDAGQRDVTLTKVHTILTLRARKVVDGASTNSFRMGGFRLDDVAGTVSLTTFDVTDSWEDFSVINTFGPGDTRFQIRGLASSNGLSIEIDPTASTIREITFP